MQPFVILARVLDFLRPSFDEFLFGLSELAGNGREWPRLAPRDAGSEATEVTGVPGDGSPPGLFCHYAYTPGHVYPSAPE